ncbi:MAG TPA: penicillin-binding transpeptidase domain-containing protein, partial [Patescibacteria group bacterium]|nr:penicillin-binding transpeptidase domain-containing protein [Patescibacteria group bacterium]
GLDSIEITPVGAALIAAGLARGGAPPLPHLIEEKTNLLGESYYKGQAVPPDAEKLPAGKIALIARVMKAAVSGVGKAEGTARRAAVEGLVAAMKTGTSGSSAHGLDALVIGFAPADKPVIAWALVAEHAGKAELEGARITGDFLKRIRNRLP